METSMLPLAFKWPRIAGFLSRRAGVKTDAEKIFDEGIPWRQFLEAAGFSFLTADGIFRDRRCTLMSWAGLPADDFVLQIFERPTAELRAAFWGEARRWSLDPETAVWRPAWRSELMDFLEWFLEIREANGWPL